MHQHVAALRAIIREVRDAAVCGEGLVLVRMGDPWLAKALLIHDRATRSILVAQLVDELHREARRLGVLVLVAGPVPMPQELGRAVARFVTRRAITTARRAHEGLAPTPPR